MAVRYKNKKTGSVVTYAQPIRRLENSKNFERVQDESTKTKKA